ncbi:MAG: hypothetical protein IKE01_05765 [Clostridia bacterium]|nr:hypothetical protein [Clostridia bacterium]
MGKRGNGWSGIIGLIVYVALICLAVLNPFQSSKKENKIYNNNSYTYNTSENTSKNRYYSNTVKENNLTYSNFEDEDSQTVYITNTGSKYHRSGCQYLRRSCHAISKSNAISRGYDACSRCRP